ncbi:Fumarylacetoacetate hydrolase domain-containing protein [Reticulomyxa filosa]|uniref:Fumarylacetoacetate hydrolase domain-containing protein n=1 Tax=Reticulomyxa filosa TaxID=46433 RepID=X6NJ92_RETFI|nr:Fumarylacetoacetate hydrolase domain-containing protein [Reticulomyxa filosa]|eukprot:ETO25397.1 Fumarylacetoacetate hydrolase domain-containing protein [Reticulomyxa filosa]
MPFDIFCVGLNYRQHAKESNMSIPNKPVIFMKPRSSICHPLDPILVPKVCDKAEVDYEVELVIVIGKLCKNVSESEALQYVFGYTVANDVSARKWQLDPKLSGGQWIRGKSFDTFTPLGPCILVNNQTVTTALDPNNLKLWTFLNDVKVQSSSTNDLIFNVQSLVSFLSQSTTLYPGAIILTGTPQGVGFARKPPLFLKHGDTVKVGVEHIGELVNPVKDEVTTSNL